MNTATKSFKVALLLNRRIAGKLLHPDDLQFLKSFAEFQYIDSLPETMTVEYMSNAIAGADACITSWGTPRLTEAVLDQAPALKILAHAAGSIKSVVCDSVWEKNVRVTSAAPVIAEDVAETVLGLMIISLKRVLQLRTECRKGSWYVDEGNGALMKPLTGATIGLIGASNVGRNVIKLLKPFNTKILLYDPYINEQQAAGLGVTKASLEQLMSESDVVSVHAPDVQETYHMVNKDNLALMKDGTVFINTARGRLVDEAALINELKTGRIFACLDVTDPEPPAAESTLRSMENVLLTPHMAGGCSTFGSMPLANFVIRQIYNCLTGNAMDYEVTRDKMGIIA